MEAPAELVPLYAGDDDSFSVQGELEVNPTTGFIMRLKVCGKGWGESLSGDSDSWLAAVHRALPSLVAHSQPHRHPPNAAAQCHQRAALRHLL